MRGVIDRSDACSGQRRNEGGCTVRSVSSLLSQIVSRSFVWLFAFEWQRRREQMFRTGEKSCCKRCRFGSL